MSQFTISSFPVTFVSYFFCSNNKLPTSYHISFSQMKRCKSHSDCPGGAAPVEKKGFCPLFPSFLFPLILLLPFLFPFPFSSALSSYSTTRIFWSSYSWYDYDHRNHHRHHFLSNVHQLFSLKLSQALSAAPMAGVGSHNIFKVSFSTSLLTLFDSGGRGGADLICIFLNVC